MSTIEKALQKQQAARKNKQAEKEKAESSLEKAVEKHALETKATKEASVKPVAEVPPAEPAPSEEPAVEVTEQETVAKVSEPAPEVSTAKKVPPQGKVSNKPQKVELSSIQEGFVSDVGRHVINEEYRAIKRKVLNNAFGPLAKTLNNSNIIMVTSPNPDEGKTFTAINLALSIALEKDKTVLLVDADVLRPSVMRTLDQPFENGLMEYLLNDVDDLSEIIHQTTLDTLRIIPAGKSHHLSTELLASEKMLETVNEFANRYQDRVVIIDTPPLLGINETAILANLAGQAVVVVKEGHTSLTGLSQAVDQLSPEMAKGFVINKARKSAADSDSYYGYYYGSENKK